MNTGKDYKKGLMLVIDFAVAALLIALDQWIKYVVLQSLKGADPVVLIPNVLELEYLENTGSAFGILQNQKIFILFIGAVFMAAILFLLIKLPTLKKFIPANIALAMVIAGGLGNMIDRFRFDFVVDYIYFSIINFPVFNFADCCIVIAVIVLFILFIFVYKEQDLDFLKFKNTKYRDVE